MKLLDSLFVALYRRFPPDTSLATGALTGLLVLHELTLLNLTGLRCGSLQSVPAGWLLLALAGATAVVLDVRYRRSQRPSYLQRRDLYPITTNQLAAYGL